VERDSAGGKEDCGFGKTWSIEHGEIQPFGKLRTGWQGADGSRQKLEVRDQTSEVRGKADL
jgi:hypothetical protein